MREVVQIREIIDLSILQKHMIEQMTSFINKRETTEKNCKKTRSKNIKMNFIRNIALSFLSVAKQTCSSHRANIC